MTGRTSSIGAVVIGRNEGIRLIRCLKGLRRDVSHIIYVDSGSTDGSAEAARALDVIVVALDMTLPFTAARARNAGVSELLKVEGLTYVQFVDGDCEVEPGWLEAALRFLEKHVEAAVACGRRRECHPDASVYNRLIDREWDTPVGQARACGGDALMRLEAFKEVGGYRDSMIAGEEPELCVRLRLAGWQIWRLDVEMTLHDAQITRFGQWWTRTRRAGHAYAEGASLHGRPPERHNVAAVRRALFWGAGVPLTAAVGLIWTKWAMLILLLWPAQIMRLFLRSGDFAYAFFLTLGKLPETLGIMTYHLGRWRGSEQNIIEYK